MNKQTSSNNVNAIYKGKKTYKTFKVRTSLGMLRKEKPEGNSKYQLKRGSSTKDLIYITQSSGVSLEHNFQNTFKYIQRKTASSWSATVQTMCKHLFFFKTKQFFKQYCKYITKHHELYLKGILQEEQIFSPNSVNLNFLLALIYF